MPSLASQFSKPQIEAALEHIIENKIELNPSTKWHLNYKGKTFPPKEVVRWAARLTNLKDWENMSLSGGDNVNEPLRRLGFQIAGKELSEDPLARLINTYKENVKQTGNKEEIYKWQLVNKFKGRPDLKASDFLSEIKGINYANLIYHNGIAVLHHLAKDRTEDVRALFKNLFDEGIPIEKRVKEYMNGARSLYGQLVKNLGSHQDERSIATYLTFHDPSAYAFYKNSFYKSFCQILQVPPKKTGDKYVHYLELLKNFINEYIIDDKELLALKKNFLPEEAYLDENNLILGQDILYQTLDGKIDEEESEDGDTLKNNAMNNMTYPLNQILYGPPGTGKTYHTVNEALIILGEPTNNKDRNTLKAIFDKKVEDGQIVFTTFHQSLGYEDFIEGIKPQEPKNEQAPVTYIVEDGIFKSLCKLAGGNPDLKKQTKDIFSGATFYKMSLGGLHNPDIHDWCIEHSCIALGWGDDKNFEGFKKITDWKTYRDKFKKEYPDLVANSRYNIQALYTFQKMKAGDIVVISKGNRIIDAIGRISGDYYWDDSTELDYYQFRKVEWLATNLNQQPSIFFSKKISQQSIYEFFDADVKKEAFVEFFKQEPEKIKPYILIIDEINRGNVSQIFGELITLIEKDKRLGAAEQLETILPYSKEKFGVPSNLYIIGTMNTADRSVEALDTALRRRFSFKEMIPEPVLLSPYNMLIRFHEKHQNIGWKEWLKDYKVLAESFYSFCGVGEIEIGSDLDQKMYSKMEELYFDAENILTELQSMNINPKPEFNLYRILQVINDRIEVLKDREHSIGHAYFIGIENLSQLKTVFKDNIIPLLQEYFFGNYYKIQLILGEGFITSTQSKVKFAIVDEDEFDDKAIYLVNSEAFESEESFKNALSKMNF